MAIDKAQLEKRKKYLGSSDMAAIMGLDPFRNAYDVWLEKTDKLEPQEETVVMKRGKYLEPALLNFAEDAIRPSSLERNPEKLEFISDEFYLMSHPDAMVREVNEPVEAKSQGYFAAKFCDGEIGEGVYEVWGDDNTDQVPDRVIIQCHVHLICTGAEKCYVPVYLPYREFCMFHVDYDQVIAEEIKQIAKSFWENNVLKDVPPDDVVPSLPVVKRIKREPETVTEIPFALWDEYKLACKAEKTTKALRDKAQAALLASIGTAEAGQCERGMAVRCIDHVKGYTVKPFDKKILRLRPVKDEKK